MKKEDMDLLQKDLCGRLPYGVKGNYQNSDDELLREVTIMYRYLEPNGMVMTGDIKPYLFPLSSMTDEQKDEIDKFFKSIEGQLVGLMGRTVYLIDFLNKNHFDYRELIKEGLAIDATGLGIYEQ